MMKKLVVLSEDDHKALVSLIKDSKKEIEIIKKYYQSYALCRINDKLNEVLSILTEEGEQEWLV